MLINFSRADRFRCFSSVSRCVGRLLVQKAGKRQQNDAANHLFVLSFLQWFISQQVPQFEDVKFEAASILSELFCQQVKPSLMLVLSIFWGDVEVEMAYIQLSPYKLDMNCAALIFITDC